MSAAVATVVGALLVVLALRDIVHTLLHPSGRGDASWWILRLVWRLWRRLSRGRPERLSLGGPLALLAVIGAWCVALVVGWALIYWPHLPHAFTAGEGVPLEKRSGLVTALYFSVVSISTVGFGDITPTSDALRLLSGLEAIVGFALLTVSITWVLSVFPVLTRQRTLAHEAELLRREEQRGGPTPLGAGEDAASLLRQLTQQVVLAESDLAHSPVVYFFTERERRVSLSVAMPYLLSVARRGTRADCPPGVRYAATLLGRAIRDFAATLRADFLPDEPDDVDRVLARYAEEHMRET